MKKIRKRGAVYGVIALLLCVAVYLNWSYVSAPKDLLAGGNAGLSSDGGEEAAAAEGEGEAAGASGDAEGGEAAPDDYFASSRLTREQARDEAVSTLKELSESSDADQTAKDEAAAQISTLAEQSVKEANAESLIRAKGYTDAVVMIGDGSVNVVVAPPDGGLQASDVTVIKDVVVSETGVKAGQVTIVEAEA